MAALFCTPFIAVGKAAGEFFFPEDRPSPIFSTFSFVINVIGIIWDLVIVLTRADQCEGKLRTWVILGLISHVVNIGFAIYLYMRFAAKVQQDGGKTASEAAYSLFMYDWGVCLYMCFLIWIIVWMIVAGQYRQGVSTIDSCANQLAVGIILFVVYIVVGIVMVFLSLFTECCRQPSWKRNAARQQPARHDPGNMYATDHDPPPQQQQRRGLFSSLFGPSRQAQQAAPQPAPQQQQQHHYPQQMYAGPRPQDNQPQHAAPPPTNPNFRQ